MSAAKDFVLFGRLREAIQKVKFLLSFNATRWIFSSIKGSSPGSRRLSFNRQPSLLDCVDDCNEVGSSSSGLSRNSSFKSWTSRRTASSASPMSRTMSDASSSGEDIDSRAEDFIANFYRHIQMERQVSLELRYCKAKELERTKSN